jgi:hypothetical protein
LIPPVIFSASCVSFGRRSFGRGRRPPKCGMPSAEREAAVRGRGSGVGLYKQSQFHESLGGRESQGRVCETKPISGLGPWECAMRIERREARSDKQSQFREISGGGQAQGHVCETKPICSGGKVARMAHPANRTGCAKQSQIWRRSGLGRSGHRVRGGSATWRTGPNNANFTRSRVAGNRRVMRAKQSQFALAGRWPVWPTLLTGLAVQNKAKSGGDGRLGRSGHRVWGGSATWRSGPNNAKSKGVSGLRFQVLSRGRARTLTLPCGTKPISGPGQERSPWKVGNALAMKRLTASLRTARGASNKANLEGPAM